MKLKRIVFIISYAIFSLFLIWLAGNLNFFGQQGFHLSTDDVIWSLFYALFPAVILTIIVSGIAKLLKK